MTTVPQQPQGAPEPPSRRPLSSDRRLLAILLGAAVLLGIAYAWLYRHSDPGTGPSLAQYALLAGNVLVLVAVVFSLLRYLIRLLSERRAGILGSRFKFKVVATFIGLCLVPATLLYVAAVYILLAAVDKALSPDVDQMVLDAQVVARQYYEDAGADLSDDVNDLAARLGPEIAALPRAELPFRLRPRLEEAGMGACRVELTNPPESLHVGVPGLIGRRSPLDPVDLPPSRLRHDLDAVAERGHFVRQQEIGAKMYLISGAPLRNATGITYGTLLVARRIPADLKARVERLMDVAQEHARISAQEPWVKAEHALNFLWLSLVIILGATWVALYIARGITVPIQRLAEATVELRRGNLSHVVVWDGRDELADLVAAFNEMSKDLRTKAGEVDRKATELQEANFKLEAANAELERRRSHVQVMVETMTAGVLAVDGEGRVTLANRAARQILELPEVSPDGQAAETFLCGPALAELRAEIAQALQRKFVRRERATVVPLARGEVHLQVVLASQPDVSGGRGLLVLIEDVTELVRAQKLATWRQAARRIAHEIKNPLTPIQLSAQRILKKWRDRSPDLPEALESGVQTIVAEVSGLKQMVDEFSDFARMPEVRPHPGDLCAMLESVRALYVGHERLRITLACDPALPPVPFDPELLRRAVVNLVDNAVEATGSAGRVEIEASLDAEHGLARIAVTDDGPGIKAEDRDKLFLPYFTTRAEGTGLGLAIVHRIVVDHGGRVRAENRVPRGARFVVELPIDSAPARQGEAPPVAETGESRRA